MKLSQIARYIDADGYSVVSGAEAILRMFEQTDENGVLYFLAWRYDADYYYPTRPRITKCVMRWTRANAEAVAVAYDTLYDALRTLGTHWDSLETKGFQLPADLCAVREVYLRPFDGDFDLDQINDISDRLDAIDFADAIDARVRRRADVTMEEKERYLETRGITVSDEERALYDAYRAALNADAVRRVGDRPAAFDVVIRARRLCKLFSLRAPAAVIGTEALYLAQAMAVHAYAESMETSEAEDES